MSGSGSKLRGRWRSALIAGLLSAAIVMVGVLAMQTAYAFRVHREVAESVLRDYARVVADEFIRRTSAELGYRGYYAALTAIEKDLSAGDPSSLPEPSHELVRTLFVIDPVAETLSSTGIALDAETGSWLRESVKNSMQSGAPVTEPFFVLHRSAGDAQRSFVFTTIARPSAREPLAAGFEVEFDALAPWFQRVVDRGPLLPASLGDGELSNDLLSIRLTDAVGRRIYGSGETYDSVLTTSTPFGATYSGIFEGMTLFTAIHPDAASRLVIGGLPRSRLPVLLGLLTITVGLLVAAIYQLRRERTLSRLRTDFVSRVSHELRTPLTQIRLFAETLLLERYRNDDERRRSLEIVDQEARRLSHLVENILQFSRGDRGAIRLAPQSLDLVALLHDLSQKFLPIARARQATLVPVMNGAVVCFVDSDAMAQIVLNLLDNAVKYGPVGQEVRFGVERHARSARVWVEDEGPGVPESERSRIWQRWQRLERDERSAVAGTGIGLTVVRDLVLSHGGRVWVEGSSRGGARFVVELPCAATGTERNPT